MKTLTFLFLPFLFLACQNEPKPPPPGPNVLLLESMTTTRDEGQCDMPGEPCAHISLKYPVVKSGKGKLKKSVANWAHDFLIGMLDPGLEADAETSLSSAIEGFVEMHREVVEDMPELPNRYEVEVTDTILFQNKKHLTLRLDGYSFTGGAHPNAFASIATFDLQSGRQLKIDDLVTDRGKLKDLAEKHFRKARPDIFAEGFDFDEGNPFALASNVGITTEGLFFCYVPYEVTPYALGFTEFVIPFDEVGDW